MSYYPIKLDKERLFKYGMKAISTLEKKFKKPVSKIDMDNMTMEETATLMWAGLVHEDRSLTPDKVMDLVDDYSDMRTALEITGEAFKGAFGVEDEIIEEGIEEKND